MTANVTSGPTATDTASSTPAIRTGAGTTSSVTAPAASAVTTCPHIQTPPSASTAAAAAAAANSSSPSPRPSTSTIPDGRPSTAVRLSVAAPSGTAVQTRPSVSSHSTEPPAWATSTASVTSVGPYWVQRVPGSPSGPVEHPVSDSASTAAHAGAISRVDLMARR